MLIEPSWVAYFPYRYLRKEVNRIPCLARLDCLLGSKVSCEHDTLQRRSLYLIIIVLDRGVREQDDQILPSQRKPTKKNKKELPSFKSVSEVVFAILVVVNVFANIVSAGLRLFWVRSSAKKKTSKKNTRRKIMTIPFSVREEDHD